MNRTYRILRRTGAKVEYLAHVGHDHYWTQKIDDAMVYTKLQVAQDLCVKRTGNEVVTTTGEIVYTNQ